MNKRWDDDAWEDYVAWQFEDKKTLKRINALIKDIERNGLMRGIGKPESCSIVTVTAAALTKKIVCSMTLTSKVICTSSLAKVITNKISHPPPKSQRRRKLAEKFMTRCLSQRNFL